MRYLQIFFVSLIAVFLFTTKLSADTFSWNISAIANESLVLNTPWSGPGYIALGKLGGLENEVAYSFTIPNNGTLSSNATTIENGYYYIGVDFFVSNAVLKVEQGVSVLFYDETGADYWGQESYSSIDNVPISANIPFTFTLYDFNRFGFPMDHLDLDGQSWATISNTSINCPNVTGTDSGVVSIERKSGTQILDDYSINWTNPIGGEKSLTHFSLSSSASGRFSIWTENGFTGYIYGSFENNQPDTLLQKPAYGSVVANYTPRFEFLCDDNPYNDGQKAYQLQIASDQIFSDIVFDSDRIMSSDSYYVLPLENALSCGRYYWRVRTSDLYSENDEWGPWSWENLIIIEAEPGTTLSGYVKDSFGNAIENIYIRCQRDFAYTINYTVTDANGLYQLTDLPIPETYIITALPDKNTSYSLDYTNIIVTDDNNYVLRDLVLNNNSFSVSGIVTDGITSLPLGNISLLCLLDNTYLSTVTDPNGYYVFGNLPSENIYIYNFRSDYADNCVPLYLDKSYVNVDIPLYPKPSTSISGVVVDCVTAKPISNYKVIAINENRTYHFSTTSDAKGCFTINGLQPGVYKYGVECTYPDVYANNIAYGNLIHIAETENISNCMVTLTEGALVSGYVKDPNGVPVEGLDLMYVGSNSKGYMITDSVGYYSVRIPEGKYIIGIRFEEPFSALKHQITVDNIYDTLYLDDIIVYDSISGSSISGDIKNTENNPKYGIFKIIAVETGTIWDHNVPFEFLEIASVDLYSAGSFAINSLPTDSNYNVYLLATKTTDDYWESSSICDFISNVSVGTNNITLSYGSQGGTVTGYVKDIFSKPIIGAKVLITMFGNNNFIATGNCDPNGFFSIYNVPVGTYVATAIHSKYTKTLASAEFSVTEGASKDLGEIIMPFGGKKEASDLNGDGKVNTMDLMILSSDWLQPIISEADFDRTGRVDLFDFNIFAENWYWKMIWAK